MKYKTLILLLTLFMYHFGLSQNSDTLNRGIIKIARCQIMIANKIDKPNDAVPHPFVLDTVTSNTGNNKVVGNELRILTSYPRVDSVTINTLLKDPEVRLAGYTECKVASYEMFIFLNGKCIAQTSSSGKFPPQMIEKIKKLPVGTFITIGDVHIKCPGSNSETLVGKNLIISNKD
jgi:hypothetical protein